MGLPEFEVWSSFSPLDGGKLPEAVGECVAVEAVGEPLLDGGEVAEAVAEGVPVEPGQPRVVPLVLGCNSIDILGTSPTLSHWEFWDTS